MRKEYTFNFILIAAGLLSPLAYAQESPEANAPKFVSAAAGGSKLLLEASAFSGESTASYPIALLPAAGSLEDKIPLALQYRSGNGNSWAGKGWEVSLGFIDKSNKYGVGNAANPYVLSLNGATYELVSIAANQYRTKNETNMRIEFTGTLWQVWTRDGTLYKFEIANGTRWFLTRVTDTHGISAVIDYDRPGATEAYPKEIRYPEGQGLTAYCKVVFVSEARSDAVISYAYASPLEFKKRLKEIQLVAGNYVQKKHVLSYATNGQSQVSLLNTITEVGKDGSSLPPTRYDYHRPQGAAAFAQQAQVVPDQGFLYTSVPLRTEDNVGEIPPGLNLSVVDMNGDGLPDLIGCRKYSATGPDIQTEWVVYLNSVNGFSSTPVVWLSQQYAYYTIPGNPAQQWMTLTNLATLADINGDGLPDLVYSKVAGTAGPNLQTIYDLCVRYNTGTKFSDTETLLLDHANAYYVYDTTVLYAIKAGSTALLADVNGDGKADLIYNRFKRIEFYAVYDSQYTRHPLFDWVVRLNTGNGFEATERLYLDAELTYFKYGLHAPHPPGSSPSSGLRNYLGKINVGSNSLLADVNGDGLPDLVFNDFAGEATINPGDSATVQYAPAFNWKVRLNTGTKFSDTATLYYGNAPVYYYRSQGPDSQSRYIYKFISVGIKSNGMLADINNDGLPDLVFNQYATGWRDGTTYDWFPSVTWKVAYNTGTAFQANAQDVNGPADYPVSEQTGCLYEKKRAFVTTNNAYFTDIDGDSSAEIVFPRFTRFGCEQFKFSLERWETGNPAGVDLLALATRPHGGKTMFSYNGSGRFNNSGTDGKPDLPFVVPIVTAVSTDSGAGSAGTTGYAYDGGWYDAAARQFRGFRHCQTTDPLGFVSHAYFFQDDSRLGSPEREQTTESQTLYTYVNDTSAPYYTPLAQTDEYLGARLKRTNYDYDAYGNAVKIVSAGDPGVSGDEKTVLSEYALNATAWIVNLPSRERIFASADGSGTAAAETQYVYDGNAAYNTTPSKGDLTKVSRYWNTKSSFVNAVSTYDAYGNEVSRTDANNNRMAIEFDPAYRAFPVKVTNPKSQAVQYAYCAPDDATGLFGQLKSSTDANGALTQYEYDAFGRKKKMTGPYDLSSAYGSETYEYGIGGPTANYVLTRKTETPGTAAHRVKTDILDGFERVVQRSAESEDPSVFSYTTTVYNGRGEIAQVSLPYFSPGGLRLTYLPPSGAEKWMTSSYDALGRVTLVTKADGSAVQNSYSGWAATVTDENGRTKTLANDAYGRLASVVERAGGQEYTTAYAYDVLDKLLRVTDAAGNKIDFSYDSLGRKTKMIDPDMGTWTYEYDNNGNLVKTTDGRGAVINYSYDSLNRMLSKDYAAVSGVDYSYAYDEAGSSNSAGRRSSMQFPSGSSRWNYDKEGRTVKLDQVIDGATYTVEWSYDGLDRIKTLKYPNGRVVDYSFNNAGLVENISGFLSGAGYDSAQAPTQFDYANGMTTRMTYVPENLRVKTIVTGSLQGLDYSYDAAGNILNIADQARGTAKNYQYDELNRLTAGDGESYAYNAAGNIVARNGAAYQYGARPHAVTNDGAASYTYDNAGNMVAGAGRTITYNAENKPASVTANGVTTTFAYDGDGGRVKKTVTAAGAPAVTTIYVADMFEKDIVQ